MNHQTIPTAAEMDACLLSDAIPAVGWHIASLRLGYITGKVIPAGKVANHYGANVEVIRRITGATLETVRSARSIDQVDTDYLIEQNRSAY